MATGRPRARVERWTPWVRSCSWLLLRCTSLPLISLLSPATQRFSFPFSTRLFYNFFALLTRILLILPLLISPPYTFVLNILYRSSIPNIPYMFHALWFQRSPDSPFIPLSIILSSLFLFNHQDNSDTVNSTHTFDKPLHVSLGGNACEFSIFLCIMMAVKILTWRLKYYAVQIGPHPRLQWLYHLHPPYTAHTYMYGSSRLRFIDFQIENQDLSVGTWIFILYDSCVYMYSIC